MSVLQSSVTVTRGTDRPRLGKYFALVQKDLSAIYSRDIQKWLLVAPLIGVLTGLLITGIVLVILNFLWAYMLPLYYRNHLLIVPLTTLGFVLTGLIMRYLTPDPNRHSTEEIINSYHEHQGDINFRPFWFKLAAAATTVGFGGSAALEGPSIYGGGSIGSWLWTRIGGVKLTDADRRLMLISGAAAGMAAVFRAPLTGLIFALEMPYRDDLAHEALLPSLIASVVSYATLVAIMGSEPLFGFIGRQKFARDGPGLVRVAGSDLRAGRDGVRDNLPPLAHLLDQGAGAARTVRWAWADSRPDCAGCCLLPFTPPSR